MATKRTHPEIDLLIAGLGTTGMFFLYGGFDALSTHPILLPLILTGMFFSMLDYFKRH